jgi:hypothetical protein
MSELHTVEAWDYILDRRGNRRGEVALLLSGLPVKPAEVPSKCKGCPVYSVKFVIPERDRNLTVNSGCAKLIRTVSVFKSNQLSWYLIVYIQNRL